MEQIEFKDGDLILVKVNSFTTWYKRVFASMIRFFDGVYYHHAQMYFEGQLWEANETVERMPLSRNYGDEILVLRLKEELSYKEKNKVKLLLQYNLGRKYDYFGAMFHQLVYILFFRRVWIGRKGRRADHKPYCTELVTSIMHQIRGYFPEHYKIAPSKLIQLSPLYYDVVFEGVYIND